MMRRWILATVIAAGAGCGASHASEPAWPKLHASDTDGGESLAPRASATSVEAPAADDTAPAANAAVAAAPAAAGSAAAPAAGPQTIVAPTEDITTEEMNIEVDE
jgi:hypothetical protein